MYDYLIVGAGLTGCTLAERISSQLGKNVVIVEKRNHIAGNCFDYYDDNGLLVHKYGPHIFHTNNSGVWNYLSLFTGWHSYSHKVLASVKGVKLPVPFNFNSIEKCFEDPDFVLAVRSKLSGRYGLNNKIYILDMLQNEDEDIKRLAAFIYENIFLHYTIKQWGLRPEELDRSVTSRVPVFIGYDDRYFQDTYQGLPKDGYTKMIEKMVLRPGIEIITGQDYRDLIGCLKFNRLIFTGPVDCFYEYCYGRLTYRSLEFRFKTLDCEYFQEAGQINYTTEEAFTRITEYKHLTGQKSGSTSISYEYPGDYNEGINEPYYPVPQNKNEIIYRKYEELSSKDPNVIFAGRLARYKYYNMDQAVASALKIFSNISSNTRGE